MCQLTEWLNFSWTARICQSNSPPPLKGAGHKAPDPLLCFPGSAGHKSGISLTTKGFWWPWAPPGPHSTHKPYKTLTKKTKQANKKPARTVNSNSSWKRLVGTQSWLQKGAFTTNSETVAGEQVKKTSVFQWLGALRSDSCWQDHGHVWVMGGEILKILHRPHHSGQRSKSRVLWWAFASQTTVDG